MKPTSIRKFLTAWGGIFLFCFLAGSIATLWGYRYATGNQVEQLPLVMRAMDPTYLQNDFFVNASAAYSPRQNFAVFTALFTRLLPLAMVYFLFTVLGNIAIALVTAAFARDYFGGSRLAALLAAAAILTLKTFWLGYTNVIYRTFLEPIHLAMPFLLVCIWAGLRRKPVGTALAAAGAVFFHPLVGLETGALALGILSLETLLERLRKGSMPVSGRRFIIGWVLFAATAAYALTPYLGGDGSGGHISDADFVHILAFFRHPHHYIPSSFEPWQYLQAALFLIAAGCAWFETTRRSPAVKAASFQLSAWVVSLALMGLGGYVFVELIPSRWWAAAQTFRLLFIVKWLGLVLLAGWAANRLASFRFKRAQFSLLPFVLLTGLMSPISMAPAAVYTVLRERAAFKLPALLSYLLDGVALSAAAILLVEYDPDARVTFLFVVFTFMAAAWIVLKPGLAVVLNVLTGAAAVVLIMTGSRWLPAPAAAYFNPPVIRMQDISGEEMELASYVRQNTPPDAIFLVNPSMGIFRTTALRAIVVDFIAFPFGDAAMAEWAERIHAVYGWPDNSGFAAVPEMRANYSALLDRQMRQICQEYGCSYAVIYKNMYSTMPVEFETANYRLIKIE